jgi:hypothetical protein
MKRRNLPLLLVVALSSGVGCQPWASAQTAGGLNVVATAGKQRMLSQRTLKAYAQLFLGVMPDKALVILNASLEELRSANVALLTQSKGGMETELRSQSARLFV